MTSPRNQLLQLLADGRFHSGASLGQTLGISRSAVWKHVHFLQQRQVDIHAVRGRGYRLAQPLELLSRSSITEQMNAEASAGLARLHLLTEVDSTNRYLLSRACHGGVSGEACLAEYQSAGHGRQGRSWVSPFAGNIYLSLLWHFNCGAEGLGSLGLAVGVSLLRAVRSLGATQVRLKWPNDLVSDDKKLAGILLEMNSDNRGGHFIVIGVGVNVRMPASVSGVIDQAWTDLEQVLGGPLSRNRVAAVVLQQLVTDVALFQSDGLYPFIDEWRRFDNLLDRPVALSVSRGTINGVARGIDESGALRVDHDGRIQRYLAGDVTVRVSP